ncbi:MAG: sugar ABC transporter permease [Corallococcus sp.]|nr:sugar ABC transporter permease [Corallococcus sp.]
MFKKNKKAQIDETAKVETAEAAQDQTEILADEQLAGASKTESALQPSTVLVPEVGAAAAVEEEPVLHELTKWEKFKRLCKSQSGWLFVLPALILLAIFTFYPIVAAFVNAFKENYNPTNKREPFTGWGFENFARVLAGDTGTGGANFVQCLLNTIIFTFISVPISTILALLISVALNSIKALQKAYQTILFLPYLTNALAMGAVFATFFNVIGTVKAPESNGLVNNFLELFGADPQNPLNWLGVTSPVWKITDKIQIPWAKYIVVIVYEIWSGLPFKILILFSALQSVNKQYYDAAKIDGASKSTVLWKITAPMISPMISYLLITGIMGGMKQYSSIVGLFGQNMGINYDMGTMVGYIYQYVTTGEMGFAYAGSLLLFIIIMALTAVNMFVSKKKVSY